MSSKDVIVQSRVVRETKEMRSRTNRPQPRVGRPTDKPAIERSVPLLSSPLWRRRQTKSGKKYASSAAQYRSHRPARRDTERKFKSILAAAERLFLERGFEATSMDVVSEVANVSKRTVYNHFASKEALFAAVIQVLCSKIVPLSLDELKPLKESPERVLTRLATFFLTSIYSPRRIKLLQTTIADSRQFPEVGRMLREGPIARTYALVGGYLSELVATGTLKFPSPEMAAAQFIAMLKTDVHLRLLLSEKMKLTEDEISHIATCSVRLFLHGALPRRN